MRRIKECLSDGTYLLVLMLVGILVALIVFEKISPTPEGIDAETVDKMSVAQNEVVAVQEPQPQEELIIASDDLSQDVIERQNNGYYEALDLLAHLIYAESGSDSEEEMWYTGSVVLNRINSNKYPNDLDSVIYQRNQYEVTWNGALYREEPSDIAYEVAAELLNSGSVLPETVLYQSEFLQGTGIYEKVNRTYYCYE